MSLPGSLGSQAGGQGRDSEQVKDLLVRLVDEIVVESRAYTHPYFVPPVVEGTGRPCG
jgi:hypothetical protein